MLEKPLLGRVTLVTGATRRVGIGAAIARVLATRGADVAVAFYRPYDRKMPWGVGDAEPAELVEELRRFGARSEGFEIDLSEETGPSQLIGRVVEAFGGLDILVNNAAVSTESTVDELSAVDLDRHYEVNLRATALLCAEFVRRWKKNDGGRIINLTSGQGLEPMPSELAYVATKGAIDALTLSLSRAVADRGITVNAVDPGPTDTGWMTKELKEKLTAEAPAGRLGTPEDAARVVAFLTSDEAAWVTGQVIRARGAT